MTMVTFHWWINGSYRGTRRSSLTLFERLRDDPNIRVGPSRKRVTLDVVVEEIGREG